MSLRFKDNQLRCLPVKQIRALRQLILSVVSILRQAAGIAGHMNDFNIFHLLE